MKCRITTDGKMFRPEYKAWWSPFWLCHHRMTSPSGDFCDVTFKTEGEARYYLIKNHYRPTKSKWKTVDIFLVGDQFLKPRDAESEATYEAVSE